MINWDSSSFPVSNRPTRFPSRCVSQFLWSRTSCGPPASFLLRFYSLFPRFPRFVLFFSLSFFGCHFLTKCLLVWPVLNCSKQKKKQKKGFSWLFLPFMCVFFFSVFFLSSSFVFVLGRSNLRCIQNFSVPFDDAILMVVARTLTVKMMLTLILTMTTTMTIVLTIQQQF